MNKYYSNQDQINSNKRIFEAYFTEIDTRPNKLEKMLDRILSFLAILVSAITSTRARSIAKVAIVVACLIGFVGVIGAMEHGSISVGVGLLLSATLLLVEFFCLKKAFKG